MGTAWTNSKLLRTAFAVALLAFPLITVWNVTVGAAYPKRFIKFGPSLVGSEVKPEPVFSYANVKDGAFQRAVTSMFGRAMPTRPTLVRLNNEVRYTLFDQLSAPNVIKMADNQLFEKAYIDDYCSRVEGSGAVIADAAIPRLLEVQNYYRSRGAAFVYVVTPSKASDLPEAFLGRVPCPNSEAARTRIVPDYVARVREAGVVVLDLASLTHDLSKSYGFSMFPRGGIHWNMLAGAVATQKIIETVNAQVGHELLRPFTFTYVMSRNFSVEDRDLEGVLNLMVNRISQPVPELTFAGKGFCDDHPAHTLKAAAVGGSFTNKLTELLISQGCASDMQLYFYMFRSLMGGFPYHFLKNDLSVSDFAPLRDVKFLLLEENETGFGRSKHFDLFYRYLFNQPIGPLPNQLDMPGFTSPAQQASEGAADDGAPHRTAN